MVDATRTFKMRENIKTLSRGRHSSKMNLIHHKKRCFRFCAVHIQPLQVPEIKVLFDSDKIDAIKMGICDY